VNIMASGFWNTFDMLLLNVVTYQYSVVLSYEI